ncbi:hypothetical protein QFZ32_006325 [Streptomyces canus]|nr:hypothetical protein [Streptomyces canus]MDQ1070885.1 hypothetical protein [Streptomyces canus]
MSRQYRIAGSSVGPPSTRMCVSSPPAATGTTVKGSGPLLGGVEGEQHVDEDGHPDLAQHLGVCPGQSALLGDGTIQRDHAVRAEQLRHLVMGGHASSASLSSCLSR